MCPRLTNGPAQPVPTTRTAACLRLLIIVIPLLLAAACGGDSASESDASSEDPARTGDPAGNDDSDAADDSDGIDGSGDDGSGDDGSGGDGTVSDAAAVYAIALDDWETVMVDRGTSLGQHFLGTSLDEINALPRSGYYDSQRAFLQIADYLGDPHGTWNDYAQAAEHAYEAYIQPGYGMPGYERFPHGLLMDYVRNGDTNSRTTLQNLRDQGPFADVLASAYSDGWYQQRYSREVAYMIETHVMAERAGMIRQSDALAAYVDRALKHIEIWTTGDYLNGDPDWQFCQSFMTGLTASALIAYYELTVDKGDPDSRIPPALRTLGDWLIANMWLPEHPIVGTYAYEPEVYGSFKYVSPAVSGVGGENAAPDVNLLIAPLFGWLYRETGELGYRKVGDKAFAGGVAFAYLVPNKAFNQNYRTSFDYVEWRAEGKARWGH